MLRIGYKNRLDEVSAPVDVLHLLAQLQAAGYEAVLVGGCVRDQLLGLTPHDYDIATQAVPDEILRVFCGYRCVTIGKAFGTIGVVSDDRTVEITTYRTEGDYQDHRHPDTVSFTSSLEEDLSRRDFTVNAMAWHPERGLIDPFGGSLDLSLKQLKMVGDASERIREDALRMLRGIRFASRYHLRPDDAFMGACRHFAEQLRRVSPERIAQEMEKILLDETPSLAFHLLQKSGLQAVLFPFLEEMVGFSQDTPYHHLTLYEHTLCVLDKVPNDIETRWAALYHDAGKLETKFIDEKGIAHFYGHDQLSAQMAGEQLRALRLPLKRIEEVEHLIGRHMANCNAYTNKSLKRLLQKIGEGTLRKLFDLQEADCLCASNQGTANVSAGRILLEEILTKGEPYQKKQLAINGHDLMNMGIPEGQAIGEWLTRAMEMVQDDPDLNHKDILCQKILEALRRQ